ncbi:MAG: hypothetical protein ABJD11_10530 [Gemmatimonadota bacterium]
MTSPFVSDQTRQHQTFRELWAREGSLARAANSYAGKTGDCEFALREMLRDQLERPIPGLCLTLPRRLADEPALQQEIFEALAVQREEIRRSHGRIFGALAGLQQAILNSLARAGSEPAFGQITLAEARCKDLMLVARLLVEQAAIHEAAHDCGRDHPLDLRLCKILLKASDGTLAEFDLKLEAGWPLQRILMVEILVESLSLIPPGHILPFTRGGSGTG